jgi:hypothetical protein
MWQKTLFPRFRTRVTLPFSIQLGRSAIASTGRHVYVGGWMGDFNLGTFYWDTNCFNFGMGPHEDL